MEINELTEKIKNLEECFKSLENFCINDLVKRIQKCEKKQFYILVQDHDNKEQS